MSTATVNQGEHHNKQLKGYLIFTNHPLTLSDCGHFKILRFRGTESVQLVLLPGFQMLKSRKKELRSVLSLTRCRMQVLVNVQTTPFFNGYLHTFVVKDILYLLP